MKLKLYMALAAASLGLAACSTDGYWDEAPESLTGGYSFLQSKLSASSTLSEPMSRVAVTLTRSNTSGDFTLPVTFESDGDLIGEEAVTFKNGESTATYYVNIGEVEVGVEYACTLNISKDMTSAAGNQQMVLMYMLDYTWEAAGSAQFYSSWSGSISGGLKGNGATVQIQKAKETEGLYRLVSPYYYSETEMGATGVELVEGCHIKFQVDPETGELTGIPAGFHQMGESDSDYGDYYFFFSSYYDFCYFYNQDNFYVVNGAIAYEGEDGYSLYTYETFAFIWNGNYPW